MNRICKSLILNVRAIGQISRSQVNYAHPALGSLLALNNRIPALNVDVRTFVNKRQPKFVDFKGPRDEFQPPKYSKRFQPPTIENDDQYADAEPVEAVGHEVSFKAEAVKNGFAEFGLPDELIKRLDELNYKQPFEIQAATLKHTLAGKDVVGKAFTGSGKTLAFAIPIITRVLKSEKKNNPNPKCLVLSPTRELCQQLYTAIQDLAPQLKCIAIFGGAGYESQISKLGRGVDIVIATPGRLRDLMQRKNFIPDDIELVCLDEADEMLNPNFLDQIQDVLEAARKDKQMLMFSATLNKSVAEIVNDYMKNPVVVDLTKGKTQKLPANIEHYMHKAPEHRHARIAGACIDHFKSERCIIFVNRKKLASEISYKLKRTGIRSGDLHSDLSQTRREIILRSFREGRLNVIVATDVASRGIDVPEVDLVIQLEAPPSGVDYYVHRSGRTGRAGRTGKSVLIHSGSADQISRELSRLVKFKPIDILKDLEPTSDFSDDRRQKFTNKSRFNENDEDDDDILDSREHKPMRFTPRSSSSTYNTYNTYKGPRSYSAPRRFTDRSRFDDDSRSNNYRRFNSDYEDESDDEERMGVRKSFQPRRDQEFSRGKTSYSGGFRANREFKSFEPRNKSGESRNLFEDN